MNILFLCKKVPYPPTDGESLVIMNDLRVLKALGHEVSLFCLNTRKHWVNTDGFNEQKYWDEFRAVEINTNSLLNIVRAVLSSNPLQIARFYNTFIDYDIENFIKNKNIDIIIYQGLAMTQYQRSTKCKRIYRVHNLEYKVWSLLAVQTKNFFRKQFNHWISNSLKFYEKSELKEFSGIVTLSNEEKSLLNSIYSNVKIITIPISITSESKFIYSSDREGLLFIGSLDWQPNREGLDWFLRNVYPSINHIPLTIAGKGDFKCDLKNVTVISNYESTEELLANHRLMIVPLLSGAGIRIKILEALNFGMPLISTTIGAEGIEFHQGSIIIEDMARNWISQIENAYSQPSILSDMSQKAKLSYESHYSDEVISSKWESLLNHMSYNI